MGGNSTIFDILCFIISRKVKTTDNAKKIHAVYEECSVTDQICQKWFTKFCAGDFLLNNPPWSSGRPVEVLVIKLRH